MNQQGGEVLGFVKVVHNDIYKDHVDYYPPGNYTWKDFMLRGLTLSSGPTKEKDTIFFICVGIFFIFVYFMVNRVLNDESEAPKDLKIPPKLQEAYTRTKLYYNRLNYLSKPSAPKTKQEHQIKAALEEKKRLEELKGQKETGGAVGAKKKAADKPKGRMVGDYIVQDESEEEEDGGAPANAKGGSKNNKAKKKKGGKKGGNGKKNK